MFKKLYAEGLSYGIILIIMESKTTKLSFKNYSDELEKAGDYCFTKNLGNTKDNTTISAIIIKCPFCAGDMASTAIHKIEVPSKAGLFRKLLTLLGFSHGVTVTPMLQCPYNNAHVFNIKKGKLIFKLNGTRPKERN